MEMNLQYLVGRISATLRAKQFLVFYAIAIYAVEMVTPLLTDWLSSGDPLSDVYRRSTTLLYQLLVSPDLLTATIVAVSLLLTTWFTAGYIRSIVGRLHFAPQNGSQFLSLLGLMLIIELVYLGIDVLFRTVGTSEPSALLIDLLQLLVAATLLYPDYAIIISGGDPFSAIVKSLRTLRANVPFSLVILAVVVILVRLVAALIDPAIDGGLRDMIGLLVVRTIAIGAVTFVADVALVMVYIDAVERGALRSHRRRAL